MVKSVISNQEPCVYGADNNKAMGVACGGDPTWDGMASGALVSVGGANVCVAVAGDVVAVAVMAM